MQIALPELNAPATLILDREDRLTDDEYFAFCVANPDLNVERTAEGDIVIVPPLGGVSDFRYVSVTTSLTIWARMDSRGKAFGSSVHFLLPDGSGAVTRCGLGLERTAGAPFKRAKAAVPARDPGVRDRSPVTQRSHCGGTEENGSLDGERRRTADRRRRAARLCISRGVGNFGTPHCSRRREHRG